MRSSGGSCLQDPKWADSPTAQDRPLRSCGQITEGKPFLRPGPSPFARRRTVQDPKNRSQTGTLKRPVWRRFFGSWTRRRRANSPGPEEWSPNRPFQVSCLATVLRVLGCASSGSDAEARTRKGLPPGNLPAVVDLGRIGKRPIWGPGDTCRHTISNRAPKTVAKRSLSGFPVWRPVFGSWTAGGRMTLRPGPEQPVPNRFLP